MALTKRDIDQAKYQGSENSRDVRWDDSLPGFGIRVFPTGRKSFVLSYRFKGRKRLMTIGRYGVLTLQEARDRARKFLVQITDGEDPLEIRNREKHGITVEEFTEIYVERHAKPRKKTWEEDDRRIKKYINPNIGALGLSSITQADIASLHEKVGKNGRYEANRILALVKIIWNTANTFGFLPSGTKNPAVGIEPYKEKSRDRFLKPEELPKLAEAIGKEDNLYIRAAFWLLLLTGVRKSELLHAKWEDIDLNRQELKLEDTKAGRTHYVPLSEAVILILRALPHEHDNPYILPGSAPGKHLVNLSLAWNRIRESAGCPDLRLHDIRRTVGSWMAQDGYSLELIGKVLNQSDPNTTRVYARLAEDQTRTALEEHGQKLLAGAGEAILSSIDDKSIQRGQHSS